MHKTKSTISTKSEQTSAWSTLESTDFSSSPSSGKFYGEKSKKKRTARNLFRKLNTSNNDIDQTIDKVEYFDVPLTDRKLRSADNAFDKEITKSMNANDDLVQSDDDECIVYEKKIASKKEQNAADDGRVQANVVVISSSSDSDENEPNTARSKKQKQRKFINKFRKKATSEGKDGSIIYFSASPPPQNSHRNGLYFPEDPSHHHSGNSSSHSSSIPLREPCLIFDPESESDLSRSTNQLTVPQLVNLCTICKEKEINNLMIDFREYDDYRSLSVPNFTHYTDSLDESQENLDATKLNQASLIICLVNSESKFNNKWQSPLKKLNKQFYWIKFTNQKYQQSLLTNHFTSIDESFFFLNGDILWLIGDRFSIKQKLGYVITDDADTLSALSKNHSMNSFIIDSEFVFGNETKFLNLILNVTNDKIKPLVVTYNDKNLAIAVILILLMVFQNYSLYTALLYLRYMTCGSYLSKEKSTTYPPNPFKKERGAKFMDKLKKFEAVLFGKTISKKKVREEMINMKMNMDDASFHFECIDNATRRN